MEDLEGVGRVGEGVLEDIGGGRDTPGVVVEGDETGEGDLDPLTRTDLFSPRWGGGGPLVKGKHRRWCSR